MIYLIIPKLPIQLLLIALLVIQLNTLLSLQSHSISPLSLSTVNGQLIVPHIGCTCSTCLGGVNV